MGLHHGGHMGKKKGPVDVPPAPTPKTYRVELAVNVYLTTNHLSTTGIEEAILEEIRKRDGFAYVKYVEVKEVQSVDLS
jgi:hypothetical protein